MGIREVRASCGSPPPGDAGRQSIVPTSVELMGVRLVLLLVSGGCIKRLEAFN